MIYRPALLVMFISLLLVLYSCTEEKGPANEGGHAQADENSEEEFVVEVIAQYESASSLPFQPSELPPAFWEEDSRVAALDLLRAAYAASGIDEVDIAYNDEELSAPDRFAVTYLSRMKYQDNAESLVTIVVQGELAQAFTSHSSEYYASWSVNPRVDIVQQSFDSQRLHHVAEVIWYLGEIHRRDPPPPPRIPPRFIKLSSTNTHHALAIDHKLAADGGLLATNSSSLPTWLGPNYSPDHHLVLASWLLEQVTQRAPRQRTQQGISPRTQAAARDILINSQGLHLPWALIGHAALAAGAEQDPELLPALQALRASQQDQPRWIPPRDPQSPQMQGDAPIRQLAGRSLALARIDEAHDRIVYANDTAYLRDWIRSNRSGFLWAEDRLGQLDPQALTSLRQEILVENLERGLPVWLLWQRLIQDDLAGALSIARALPFDNPGSALSLSAFRLLNQYDRDAAAERVPQLATLLGEDYRVAELLIPSLDPLRFDHPAINAGITAALKRAEVDTQHFPMALGRAALLRQIPEAKAGAIALAQAAAEAQPDSPRALRPLLGFLAELAHLYPEYHERAVDWAASALRSLPDEQWSPALLSAWAIDPALVATDRSWPEDAHGNARRLARILRSPDAATRASNLLELSTTMVREDHINLKPLAPLVSRWLASWEAVIHEVEDDHRGSLRNLAERLSRRDSSVAAPLLEQALRDLR